MPHISSRNFRVPAVALVINPVSGRGAGRQIARVARAIWRPDQLEIIEVGRVEERSQRLLELAKNGTRVVIVQGGDGSMHAVVNLLHGTDTVIGVLPTGTGNDFARALRLRRRPRPEQIQELIQRAFERVALPGNPGGENPEETVRFVDVLELRLTTHGDSRRMIAVNSINIGFDAEVNSRANAMKNVPPALKYVLAVLRSLWGVRPIRMGLGWGSEPRQHVARTMLTVLNGTYVGGGIKLAPRAVLNDGCMDVVQVAPVGPLTLLAVFPLAFLGWHCWHPAVSIRSAERMSLELPEGCEVYVDGEPVHDGTERATLEITVLPNSLELLTESRRAGVGAP